MRNFKRAYLFLFFFTQNLFKQLLCQEAKNQFQCYNEQFKTSCNSILTQDYIYFCSGRQIFSSQPSQYVQNFAVSSWFFLKGNLNQDYNLVTVLEGNQILFKVEYNIPQGHFVISFLSNSPVYQSSINVSQNWYYVRLKLEVILNSIVNLSVIIMLNDQTSISQTYPNNSRISTLFKGIDLLFDIGDGQGQSKPSCLLVQKMFVYWDSNLLDSSLSNLFDDLTAYDTFLKWNYDTFYTKQNKGYLIQNNNHNGKLPISISSTDQFVLKNNEQIASDFINVKQNKGFVLTFHFKLIHLSVSSTNYIIMAFNSYVGYNISFKNNKLYFLSNQISGFQLNKWNQATIVFRKNLDIKTFFMLNNDPLTLTQDQFGSDRLQYVQIKFGDDSNTAYQMKISYIRVYEGNFLSQTNECFMLAARKIQQCIICRNGYLIDYQNNLNCVVPSLVNKSTLIDNVKDWHPQQFLCPKNMILNSENTCVCPFQFYRIGDDCYKCKSYCQGCIDASTCVQMHPKRQMNGICKTGLFDDGFNCIQPQFNIKSRINYEIKLNPSGFITGCTQDGTKSEYITDNSVLQIKKGQGFFFSFQIIVGSIGSTISTIAFLSDSGGELLSIMLENGAQSTSICLYIISNKLSTIQVNAQDSIQIGLWTDFKDLNFYVNSLDFLQNTSIDISSYFIGYTLNSPNLCIGKCNSVLMNQYVCAAYSSILYIYSLEKPLNKNQINNIFDIKTKQICFFKYDFLNLQSIKEITDDITKINLISKDNIKKIRFKGLKFTSNQYGYIQGINLENIQPTFSCYIYLESISVQQKLFSILNVQYLIVPEGTKAAIRICKAFICEDTKYAMLNLNEQNYLYIIYRNRGQFSNYLFQEYEIFCNEQREIIKFTSLANTYDNSQILIFKSDNVISPQISTIYLNKIRLEVGQGSYYYDQNNEERCFLFRNILDMECVIPKKGYLFYQNNIIISQDECRMFTFTKNSLHIIDPSSQECIETGQSPYCTELFEDTVSTTCKKCKYTGQDPSLDCQCIDGNFFNAQTNQCEKCSPKCQTCKDSFDNCIQCISSDQLPPSCNCLNPNYYFDQSLQCMPCSHKCKTCNEKSNQCLECSKDREDPPSCNCKLQYNEINSQCEKIDCDLNCLTCDKIPSNCIQCKYGRVNPPKCECIENYIKKSDGTCSQCGLGYYYNKDYQTCQECSVQCLSCINSQQNCVACKSGLFFQKNQCLCEKGTSLIQINNQVICMKNMNVNLIVSFNVNYYVLVFTFDHEIQQINSKYLKNITELISLGFQEIPKNLYELSDPMIKGNQLTLNLNVKQNFQTQKGWVQVLDNTQFISTSQKFVLDQIYTTKLLKFTIGPFIFNKENLDGGTSDQIIHYFKNSDQDFFNFMNQFQVLLYILNTAQPSVLFLLLKAQFPPNLYKFYQVIGLIVFPDVVDYQSTNFKQDFQLYKMDLNQTEVQQSNDLIYKKLGFSNSFLINTQGVIVKYLLIIILISITQLIAFSKSIDFLAKNISQQCEKLCNQLKQLINSENDTNLLILLQSILIQFTFVEEQYWAIRYGYYLAIFYLILFTFSFYLNFKEINSKQIYDESNYSFQYTERLTNLTHKVYKNYFLIQLLKKYLLLFILFGLKQYPQISCIFNGIIIFLSAIISISQTPYKHALSRYIKCAGELIISICWFIHLPILALEKKMVEQIILNQNDVDKYLLLGKIIIILLIIFNGIFLIEKLMSILNLINTKFIQKKNNNKINSNQQVEKANKN